MSRRWILALAVVAAAGCGSEPQLGASTAAALHKEIAAARTAAGAGDRDAAVAALTAAGKRIDRAESAGELSPEAADALRRGVARARRRAAREIAPPQPTPEPTPAATAQPRPRPPRPRRRRRAEGQGQGPQEGQARQGEGRVILEAGTEIAGGRYTLVEHLGSGGMASVWLATDETLQRDVAIKVMSDLLSGDERWLKRFRREARAAASLSHPNIVKVFDFGIEDARPYLIMAHVAGGSVKDQLAAGTELDAEALARELLGALAHVHAAGILHRDVKPGNILLDAQGASHLTDFGIARPSDATQMTQTGMVMGTVRFLAPEVAAGEPASERSDLYSAGRVLRDVAGDGGGPQLQALIAALTSDDPGERPASAEAALGELEAPTAPTATTSAVAPDTGATAVMRPQPRPASAARAADAWLRDARRSPWFAPGAALAAIVLLAIIVVALAAGGGGSGGSAPKVAPADAPLEQQLRQLDRAIDATR